MRRALLAALFLLAATAEAGGRTYLLEVMNHQHNWEPFKLIKVVGGTVTGLPPPDRQGANFFVFVKLDGPCYTRVSLWFVSGHRADVMVDICSQQGIRIE